MCKIIIKQISVAASFFGLLDPKQNSLQLFNTGDKEIVVYPPIMIVLIYSETIQKSNECVHAILDVLDFSSISTGSHQCSLKRRLAIPCHSKEKYLSVLIAYSHSIFPHSRRISSRIKTYPSLCNVLILYFSASFLSH